MGPEEWVRLVSQPVTDVRDWQEVLHRMGSEMLFKTALASPAHFDLVRQFNRDSRRSGIAESRRPRHTVVNDLCVMPTEIMEQILLELPLRDRISFGATCARNRGLACRASRLACAKAVRPYGLTFYDITFLQEGIGAIVSGSTITQIVHSDLAFVPGDLDVYCPACTGYHVVLFLSLCIQYSVDRRSDQYDDAHGLRYVWWLSHPDASRPGINVIESLSDNALDAVLHFHSTPVMGAWVAGGVWHAYPKATMRGLAVTSPARLPLTGAEMPRLKAAVVVQKYVARGYTFLAEWIVPHTCGVDWTCPVTLRTSTDDGCLWHPFDGALHRHGIIRSGGLASSWTLGSAPCPTSMVHTFGRRVVYYKSSEMIDWKTIMKSLTTTA